MSISPKISGSSSSITFSSIIISGNWKLGTLASIIGIKLLMPANTPLSDKISQDLKSREFKFVGSTIVYAHMQAMGMVNDHTTNCFRHKEV